MNSQQQERVPGRTSAAPRRVSGPDGELSMGCFNECERARQGQAAEPDVCSAVRIRLNHLIHPSLSRPSIAPIAAAILLWILPGCGSQAVQPGSAPPTLTVPANRPSVAATPQPVEPVVENTTNGELESVPTVSASSILGSNEEPAGSYYKVRSGDSLTRIAQQHQVSLNSLISENGLSTTTVLQPGQLIYIPERQD